MLVEKWPTTHLSNSLTRNRNIRIQWKYRSWLGTSTQMSRELPRLKSNVFRYINIYHRYIVLREWLSQNGKSYIIIILIEKCIEWMTYPTTSTSQIRAPTNSCYGHVAIMWRSIVRTNKQKIVPNLVFFVFFICFCFFVVVFFLSDL